MPHPFCGHDAGQMVERYLPLARFSWSVRPPRDHQDAAPRVAKATDGLKQAEIGEIVGLSQMHVSRVLRGAIDKLRRAAAPAIAC